MSVLILDANFTLRPSEEKFWPVLDFFSHVLARDTARTIESLLQNGGMIFEAESCDIVPDWGEEPFEGVRFSIYRSWVDESSDLYISEDDFYDALRLVVKCHLHTHPDDEKKMRKIIRKKGIAFETN